MEVMSVGREKELGQLYNDLASKKSVRLVVGEAGHCQVFNITWPLFIAQK
jgi:hypothetical protein